MTEKITINQLNYSISLNLSDKQTKDQILIQNQMFVIRVCVIVGFFIYRWQVHRELPTSFVNKQFINRISSAVKHFVHRKSYSPLKTVIGIVVKFDSNWISCINGR